MRIRAVYLLLLIGTLCLGQTPPDTIASLERLKLLGQSLAGLRPTQSQSPPDLRSFLDGTAAADPALATAQNELELIASGAKSPFESIGSAAGWLENHVGENLPAAYGTHASVLPALLEAAIRSGNAEAAQAVAADLLLKREDCRVGGHGRLVKVSVETLRGGAADEGWQVFYLWKPAAVLPQTPQTLAFPKLSSPTTTMLPPGLYEISARKASGGETETAAAIPVAVFGGQAGAITIQLPLPATAQP